MFCVTILYFIFMVTCFIVFAYISVHGRLWEEKKTWPSTKDDPSPQLATACQQSHVTNEPHARLGLLSMSSHGLELPLHPPALGKHVLLSQQWEVCLSVWMGLLTFGSPLLPG